jgi:hypothetical protein
MRKAMSKLYGVQHHAADDIVAFELTTTASCAPTQHTLSRQERPLTRLLTVLQTFGISPLCCNVGRCSGGPGCDDAIGSEHLFQSCRITKIVRRAPSMDTR